MLKRIVPVLLALGVLIPLTQQPAHAQTQGLTLDARAGFDGYVQQGEWLPIQVTASNDGEDLVGELRVEMPTLTGSSALYTRPIDLPQGSRKTVTVYVGEVGGFAEEVRVDLVERGRVVLTEEVELEFVGGSRLLIGQWSDNAAFLRNLGEVRPNDTAVAFITAEDLPDVAAAWSALDVLVVADTDTTALGPDQRAALEQWIISGGRLIVGGGTGALRTAAGLEGLLPLTPTDTTEASIETLGQAAGDPFGQGIDTATTVATGDLSEDAEILLTAEDGTPLIVYQEMGAGRVDYIAADLGLEPLRSWENIAALWTLILAVCPALPGWAQGPGGQWSSARTAVAALPNVSLPSNLQLCGFLGLYVLLIGPINYLVLWRLKKRELAWFTIPILVVAFSLIAYFTGFQLGGSRPILHRLAVVQLYPGTQEAQVNGLLGVWSPRRTAYQIELDPGTLAQPIPPDTASALVNTGQVTIESDPTGTVLRDVRVDVGAIQPFMLDMRTADVPQIGGDVEVNIEDGLLTMAGDVINFSPLDFTDLSLIFAGTVIRLPDLPAGEVLRVAETVSLEGGSVQSSGTFLDPPSGAVNQFTGGGGFYYSGYYSGPLTAFVPQAEECYLPENTRICSLASSVLRHEGRGSRVYLVGWTESVPYETQLLTGSADTEDLSMYIVQLGASFDTDDLSEIPPGLMTWAPLTTSTVGTPYDLALSGDVEAAFRFQPISLLPPISADTIVLRVRYDGGSGTEPIVQLRNVQTNEWEEVEGIVWGANTINNAQRFIAPNGAVDARLISSTEFYNYISTFDITLIETQ
ncbi:MAG: hypothetical protein ACFB51_03985 [Anaerolineae bacterium]